MKINYIKSRNEYYYCILDNKGIEYDYKDEDMLIHFIERNNINVVKYFKKFCHVYGDSDFMFIHTYDWDYKTE